VTAADVSVALAACWFDEATISAALEASTARRPLKRSTHRAVEEERSDYPDRQRQQAGDREYPHQSVSGDARVAYDLVRPLTRDRHAASHLRRRLLPARS